MVNINQSPASQQPTPQEIISATAAMQQKCTDAYLSVTRSLWPGMSELEIAQAMTETLHAEGVTQFWYDIPVVVLSGPERFMPDGSSRLRGQKSICGGYFAARLSGKEECKPWFAWAEQALPSIFILVGLPTPVAVPQELSNSPVFIDIHPQHVRGTSGHGQFWLTIGRLSYMINLT